MGGMQYGLSRFRSARAHDDYGSVRRSVLRRVVASAITSPMGFLGVASARADGNDNNKNKKKDRGDKDKGGANNNVSVNAPGGVPQTSSSQSTQTVVNANNQVCAGNCAQTNQQVVTMDTTQTTLAGSRQQFFGTPPTYWIDAVCNFDAPHYRTICDCTARGAAGAPPVRQDNDRACGTVSRDSEETSVVQGTEKTQGSGAVRPAAGRPTPATAAWPRQGAAARSTSATQWEQR